MPNSTTGRAVTGRRTTGRRASGRRAGRIGVAAIAAATAASLTAGTAGAATSTSGRASAAQTATRASATPTTTDRAAAAAGYLARHLQGKHHDHYTLTFGSTKYVDYGTTADAILSMDAAGVAQAPAARATAYLESHARNYAAAKPTYYPGSTAKLLLVALAQHRNVHDFGGVDLVAELQRSESAAGAQPGEFQQNPGAPANSTAYIVSQALPVLALALTPGAAGQPDGDAIAFLANQQCSNGAFSSTVRDDTTKPCADNDVDSTGYAVQALLAAGAKQPAAKALVWLAHARNSDGGFGTPASNANSTALAVQALVAGRRSAASGIKWLRHHQVGCAGKPARRGAVKFQSKYDASALRATSQAGAALAGKPLAWIDRTGAHRATPTLAC
ncbi:MAG TPA: prenyltransferase/squalene oxidase repeat-containing protein [Mycobacteriales bacterium]|nr:prenyltransferase/squalene oxidase repeat-containing protein [Mycobacteriales bacterium]